MKTVRDIRVGGGGEGELARVFLFGSSKVINQSSNTLRHHLR